MTRFKKRDLACFAGGTMARGDILDLLEHKKYRRTGGPQQFRSGAMFHTTNALSRSSHRSAIDSAAYRSRSKMIEADGTVRDWTRKGDDSPVIYQAIFLPAGASEKFMDRQTLWVEADKAETAVNARYARDNIVHIPPEVQDRIPEICKRYSEWFTSKGFAVDVNVHAPGKDSDQRNIHAHVMITDRPIEGDHFAKDKKEFRKYRGPDFTKKAHVVWAKVLNEELELKGERLRVDPRKNSIQFAEAIYYGDYDRAEELAKPSLGRVPKQHIYGAQQGNAKSLEYLAKREAKARQIEEERRGLINSLRAKVEQIDNERVELDKLETEYELASAIVQRARFYLADMEAAKTRDALAEVINQIDTMELKPYAEPQIAKARDAKNATVAKVTELLAQLESEQKTDTEKLMSAQSNRIKKWVNSEEIELIETRIHERDREIRTTQDKLKQAQAMPESPKVLELDMSKKPMVLLYQAGYSELQKMQQQIQKRDPAQRSPEQIQRDRQRLQRRESPELGR